MYAYNNMLITVINVFVTLSISLKMIFFLHFIHRFNFFTLLNSLQLIISFILYNLNFVIFKKNQNNMHVKIIYINRYIINVIVKIHICIIKTNNKKILMHY